MNVGVIGTGNMGTMLIESFIRSRALEPNQIFISNRTVEKAIQLAKAQPGIKAVSTNTEVAEKCDVLFLCVRPTQFRNVIDDIHPVVTAEQLIVSITSPVSIRLLEDHLPSKIAKVIPSVTNYMSSGATLAMYGSRMSKADIDWMQNLLQHISKPIRVSEQFTRISSDLSSCGPAFIAFILEKFVRAAVNMTDLPQLEANQLAAEMILGTGLLLTTGGFTLETLRNKVTVPGGITAEGLQILAVDLDQTFERLIRTTHQKFDAELEKVEGVFLNPT
jgi:competence protein ComER